MGERGSRIEAKQMAVNPLKALLLLAAGCTAAAATAYVSEVFIPFDKVPSAALLPNAASSGTDANAARLPGKNDIVEEQLATASAVKAVLPTFDLVSVQGDGSIVIAGRAAPNARVEASTQTRNIGATTARSSNGDFAIAIDEPLKPGDYQILLRQIIADKIQLSRQAAIISIPEAEDGQVLVLVQMAGEASRLITVPNAKPNEPGALTLARGPATAVPPASGNGSSISVEAVEIEGSSVFVVGAADPGSRVLAYADNIMIGEAVASPAGRFMIKTERELAFGEHIIRVDAVGADGAEVLARIAVPFTNEGGDAIGNLLSAASGAQGTKTAPAAETTSTQTENVNRAVIIRRGDTLWRISRRVYGQGVRFSTIYLANQNQIKDPDRIWPGQVFQVPPKD
jgi:nucleoid-associated protein YgaU